MAFSASALEAELDKAVSEADTYADLVDRYADVAEKFVGVIPSVGPEAEAAIKILDKGTAALDKLKAALTAG